MKRLGMVLAVLLAFSSGVAFARAKKTEASGKKLRIVTTIFPEYDWVRQVMGERAASADVELTLLMAGGVDLHSFQPSVQDIAKVAAADIFMYVGGESDGWAEDALKNVTNGNMAVINLLDVLDDRAKEEEIIEGMQLDADDDGEAEDGPEYDEHVWLSLRNARIFCSHIATILCSVDEAHTDTYLANAAAYGKKLAALDEAYSAAVADSARKTLLFADRFPFRYLTDDYGLGYYAAFVGCSAETEASFRTIVFLSGKVDELALKNVCQIESGNGKLARTVIQNSGARNVGILTFDSMQSVTARDIKNGATYLGIMEKNLDVLKEALR